MPPAISLSAQPVFISYSRKDYYFAESLAFHLLNRNVPVWLDVKDLKPGVDWERDLEAAVAAASSVILVGSPGAFKSVNVCNEWQRAVKLGKRIIVARRRGLRLPDELKGRETVASGARYEGASPGVCIRRLADGCWRCDPTAGLGAVRNTIGSGGNRSSLRSHRVLFCIAGATFGAAADFSGTVCTMDRAVHRLCHRVRPDYPRLLLRHQSRDLDSRSASGGLSLRCANTSSASPANY